jgi:hypothetical protein
VETNRFWRLRVNADAPISGASATSRNIVRLNLKMSDAAPQLALALNERADPLRRSGLQTARTLATPGTT